VSRVTRSRSRPANRGAALVAWIVGAEAAGALSALLSRRGAWYGALSKPGWAPPDWLHAPVMFLLYGALAVAGWLVWREGPAAATRRTMGLLAVLLLLAVLWGPLFFGVHRPDLAMLDLSALWVANVLAIRIFHRIRPAAGWLLVPFLGWVTVAAALTLSIWLRNG
jgi:benzodiazapine receptor